MDLYYINQLSPHFRCFILCFLPRAPQPFATSQAVYGGLSALGASRDASASVSVPQESSESDADVQQILKDFKVWSKSPKVTKVTK